MAMLHAWLSGLRLASHGIRSHSGRAADALHSCEIQEINISENRELNAGSGQDAVCHKAGILSRIAHVAGFQTFMEESPQQIWLRLGKMTEHESMNRIEHQKKNGCTTKMSA